MHTYLETLPFWKELTEEQRHLLTTHTIERSFQKGDILDHGNQECTGLEMIVKGQARIFMMSPHTGLPTVPTPSASSMIPTFRG